MLIPYIAFVFLVFMLCLYCCSLKLLSEAHTQTQIIPLKDASIRDLWYGIYNHKFTPIQGFPYGRSCTGSSTNAVSHLLISFHYHHISQQHLSFWGQKTFRFGHSVWFATPTWQPLVLEFCIFHVGFEQKVKRGTGVWLPQWHELLCFHFALQLVEVQTWIGKPLISMSLQHYTQNPHGR